MKDGKEFYEQAMATNAKGNNHNKGHAASHGKGKHQRSVRANSGRSK